MSFIINQQKKDDLKTMELYQELDKNQLEMVVGGSDATGSKRCSWPTYTTGGPGGNMASDGCDD
ncbi:hypothetical protein [Alkalimonas amylolytica]|uniref:Uncharacterized protein n=1 Tax=Alkalimonas amylolytica TaxID=152573 RepID=A0A1H3Y0A6_ALKAM|nr:hypothetical protein [Alkalimonas amylolytica]SEA04950.1 hypothetical protein SAMN04488051_101483 [Alkalimonas amylolytica]